MDFLFPCLYYMLMGIETLKFLHGMHAPQCRARVDKHYRGYFSLQYLTRGSVTIYYGKRRFRVTDSGVWFAGPGLRTQFSASKKGSTWEHRYIAFQGRTAERWHEQGLMPYVPQRPPGGHFTARFDQMLSLAFRNDKWGPVRAANMLEGIVLELAEARTMKDSPEEPWLVHAREVLGDVDYYPPDYTELAKQCNMAPSTLRRRFHNRMGMSMQHYALRARLNAAAVSLTDTDIPIKQIAADLGYQDVYFFSRQFRKYMGLPPGRFRASRQNQPAKLD